MNIIKGSVLTLYDNNDGVILTDSKTDVLVAIADRQTGFNAFKEANRCGSYDFLKRLEVVSM